jgi:hypothetical protein
LTPYGFLEVSRGVKTTPSSMASDSQTVTGGKYSHRNSVHRIMMISDYYTFRLQGGIFTPLSEL